jgi:hypothetical protein
MNTENVSELVTYEFKTKKGTVVISFEDTTENPKFRIQGPKAIIAKAIAGIGDENETEAWATEENLKTEAQRMYALLEAIKAIQAE